MMSRSLASPSPFLAIPEGISVDRAVVNTVRSRQVADDPRSGRHTYYRGVFFATVALRVRSALPRRGAAFREFDCYQQMGKEYRGATSETKRGLVTQWGEPRSSDWATPGSR